MKLKNVLWDDLGSLVAYDFRISIEGKLTKADEVENSLESSFDMNSQYVLVINGDSDNWTISNKTTGELLLSYAENELRQGPAFRKKLAADARIKMFPIPYVVSDAISNRPAINLDQ